MSETPFIPSAPSAHIDDFARRHLPPPEAQPRFGYGFPPELRRYAPRINVADELLDKKAAAHPGRPAIIFEGGVWSYGELLERANRIAHVLVSRLGVRPGNRVLIRAPNNPAYAACWLAIQKAGAICVATMPLLRARELAFIGQKAQVDFALCDHRLMEEMEEARKISGHFTTVCTFTPLLEGELGRYMETASSDFENVPTAADDVSLIAFTSGTTGEPKGCMHYHRDVMAICDTFSRYVLKPRADDIFSGTPPLAFTYGLGGLLLFPLHAGAATVLLEKFTPESMQQAIQDFRISVFVTAPTAYRTMLATGGGYDLSSLRECLSAGETLPRATWEAWHEATGVRIIDGIGATEMLHIFIACGQEDIRPGSTGRPVPGYEAKVVDENGDECPPGTVGRLAVRGPTGCRYLDNPQKQHDYVQDGWNYTGDSYLIDEDGYFWYQARTDDMIISAGYNISGPEVEAVLLEHEAVAECAVVSSPDAARGSIVKAFIVLKSGVSGDETLKKALQDHVKNTIAPYKYPRAIAFIDALPKTQTGKIQRFILRQREWDGL